MPEKILAAVACNLDVDILAAALPLFAAGKVEAIEWSFDTLFRTPQIPAWFSELLQTYGQAGRLIGHGVYFSLFSGQWSVNQQNWLQHLRELSGQYTFDHITEHFGFMTGQNFHHGAPLPIPYSASTLAIGQDRLARIQDACKCPVGLENLAFSYSLDEVKQHGQFLAQLITPVNGFIILDLHNLYCQLHNFRASYDEIVNLYPLDRVREIHISGGSWESSAIEPNRQIRRDTHDEAVPEEVFALLAQTIDKCPNLKFVVLEQLGNALKSEESKQLFYADFLKMEAILQRKNQKLRTNPAKDFLPLSLSIAEHPIEDKTLAAQQVHLSRILENASSAEEAIQRLQTSSLAHSDWQIETWEPYMIETAHNIARKWKM
ncbi:DUF692 family protein [Adhaeribacter swui]|uniref:DUF692 family protein n=1 Tax=Adhaeribacter swui TaxID=2086471 RepID=A0A7G7G7Q2_9BACT|nr:DUF692 family multinuclear iron-containing protein [Adhaeribacter swui]QNF33186.1 DUF692 family protein [Adhaeribacter swui]